MNEPVALRDSSIEGTGVFAKEGFARGDPILAIDDSRVVTDNDPLRDDEDEKYCDYPDDQVILMQPPERYINHACEPNAYVQTIGDTRYLLAMTDIGRDDEITIDYRLDCHTDESDACFCGTERCSGTVDWDFFSLSRRRQLAYIPYLDSWFLEKYAHRLEETILSEGVLPSGS